MRPTTPSLNPLPIGTAATLACIYEVTARKPGNVHPSASFDDATNYAAFVTSGLVIGPILARAPIAGIGQTVLDAVRETRAAVRTNTNLGTILLLAPLAAVSPDETLEAGVGPVLERLTANDTQAVYEAIRLASAGGLGRPAEADVFGDVPSITLIEAMRLTAERDLVARQYTNNFADVFAGAAAWIEEASASGSSLEQAIIYAFLHQLATCPDSLIQRKCGATIAKEASDRAASVLEVGSPTDTSYEQALADFDLWLRADGHRRNPGTTADLVAAGLFVPLREGRLNWSRW